MIHQYELNIINININTNTCAHTQHLSSAPQRRLLVRISADAAALTEPHHAPSSFEPNKPAAVHALRFFLLFTRKMLHIYKIKKKTVRVVSTQHRAGRSDHDACTHEDAAKHGLGDL